MDFSVAYSVQNKGSNQEARRMCLSHGHCRKKVADYTVV